MITIINYGMGNLGSIFNMFKRIGVESEITSDPDKISKAKKILLPGVGAFDQAMKRIYESGFKDILDHKALVERIPILGICLGMQLLTDSSEEGSEKGFGWIPGKTIKFKFDTNALKIPHMGWNTTRIVNSNALVEGFNDEMRFYFVHSYYVKSEDKKNVMLQTEYGIEFDSAVNKDNIYGAQFHPEKSHKYGMKLLENFSKL